MKKHVNILTGGGGPAEQARINELGITPPCHAGLDPESIQRPERVCNAGQILNQVPDDTRGRAGSIMGLRAAVQRLAFTMAEILLSLTIIGVVAAITLPSLTGNINERTWNTQRKALYARFSQAIALMPALNGYGTFAAATASSSAVDTMAETFVTNGLSKVLKINNICDSEHIADCGIVSKVITLDAQNLSTPHTWNQLNPTMGTRYMSQVTPNSKAVAFETVNGESILTFYNANCNDAPRSGIDFKQTRVCANFMYDLNGNKGPNTVGKDIGFITVMYPADSVVVAPMPHVRDAVKGISWRQAAAACKEQDANYRTPNLEEATSMFVNRNYMGLGSADDIWTSASVQNNPSRGIWMSIDTGDVNSFPKDTVNSRAALRCVKR